MPSTGPMRRWGRRRSQCDSRGDCHNGRTPARWPSLSPRRISTDLTLRGICWADAGGAATGLGTRRVIQGHSLRSSSWPSPPHIIPGARRVLIADEASEPLIDRLAVRHCERVIGIGDACVVPILRWPAVAMDSARPSDHSHYFDFKLFYQQPRRYILSTKYFCLRDAMVHRLQVIVRPAAIREPCGRTLPCLLEAPTSHNGQAASCGRAGRLLRAGIPGGGQHAVPPVSPATYLERSPGMLQHDATVLNEQDGS